MSIQGLIFDNGDILFDAAVWRRWLAAHLTSLDVDVTYEGLVDAWEQQLVDVYRGNANYWDRFNDLMLGFGIRVTDAARIADLAKEKGQEFQSRRRPMPQVPETLRELWQRGTKLAVLSDSESGEVGVRKILSQLQIEKYFHAVVSSRDIGVVKPDSAAFRYAIDQLGLQVSECGFVGHDIDELSGAMDCNLTAIAFNYHRDAPADVYIDSFGELLDVVACYSGSNRGR